MIHTEITMNRAQEEILYGGLLGDSSINTPYLRTRKNAVLTMEHSTKQAAYCLWKAEVLGLSTYTRDRYDARTGKTYHSIVAYSEANPTYTALYDRMYDRDGGGKRLDRNMLDAMGPLGLCIWFLDDGHTRYNNRLCVLHTEKYTLAEQQVIQRWFAEKWGLHPTIQEKPSVGGMKYKLCFNAEDSYKLMNIIRPFVPTPDMLYKVCVKPYTVNRVPQWHDDCQGGQDENLRGNE